MSKKKNKKSSKKNQSNVMALTQPSETKGNGKNTAIETLKDIAVGVIGGGLAGAAIGKPSLLTGIGTSLVGHYAGVPLMTSFGFGMMASGTYQLATGSVNGLSGMNGVKERMKLFGDSLKQRLYLDKIIKPKKKEDEGANGMGSVQYFKYPNTENKELDMGSLDNIEREIARLGEQYERKQMTGMNDDMNGIEDKLY